ncbi:hypothetical protein DAEQUDRAFT_178695 [Daedalea quercina L-15889]|uniref:Uncharacterized protein n=1 Tax=Daedalea quercina L-15889 TaxID=1314783 RepID=A0A165RE40_9APHY|nr:hypothetical protein DAEQUDRAFT_178695 [Daedalea quercina L-15889]
MRDTFATPVALASARFVHSDAGVHCPSKIILTWQAWTGQSNGARTRGTHSRFHRPAESATPVPVASAVRSCVVRMIRNRRGHGSLAVFGACVPCVRHPSIVAYLGLRDLESISYAPVTQPRRQEATCVVHLFVSCLSREACLWFVS